MSDGNYRVRRAVIDDLEHLRALWEGMRLPTDNLDKRLKECQVVEGSDGALIGVLALEINSRHGRIHGEAFTDFSRADEMREALWQRIQSVGTNHGIARYWTQETAPFWKKNGLQATDEATLKKLPAPWAGNTAGWLTLKVRDEEALEKTLDLEFSRFREESRLLNERAMKPGRTLKTIATIMAVILAIGVAIASLYLLMNQLGINRR